mgnify:CR=1 FL=1
MLKTRKPGQPFFFWYGGNEPHRSYAERSGFNQGKKKLEDVDVPDFLPDTKDVRHDFLDYSYELDWFDSHLGKMMSHLEAIGELENTVIIALGDHGDAFGENGLNHHSFVPYDNVTHIPLVVWGPDVLTPERLGRPAVPGSQLTGLRHSTDIMPTLLSLLGWGWPEGSLPGRPLFELEGHPSVISSCLSPNHCMSMRDEKYKYVQHEWFLDGLPEVYDLSKDPGERVNLASTLPEPFLREKQLQMWSAKEQLIAQYEFTARTKPHVELPEQDQMTYARVLLQQRGHIPLKSGPMEDE